MNSPFKRPLFAVALAAVFAVSALSLVQAKNIANPKPAVPKKGSVEEGMHAGLTAVANKKFKVFIKKHCASVLCESSGAKKNLLKRNLPAMSRQAPMCLRGANKDMLLVTRKDKVKDDRYDMWVKCNPKGSPRKYKMKKEGGVWKFANAY